MIEGIAYLIAILVSGICVAIHYGTLRFLSARPMHHRRHGVPVTVAGLIMVHFVEIGLFAGVFASLSGTAFGLVQGAETFLDHVYFSGSAYTTLGIGDLVPLGALRAVTAAEAIAGLVFIAWSASFAFIQMQRAWGDEEAR